MSDIRLKILAPWTITARKFEALFDGDPQIAFNIDYSGVHPAIVLACNNGDKVTALQLILPNEIDFGNVKLSVQIDGTPSNRTFVNKKELFDTAFAGNPVYAYSIAPTLDGYNWWDVVYVVFKNTVVQFFADNMNDCHGIISTLYQDIAEELLTGTGAQGVYFNTDVEVAQLGKSPDSWLA